MAGKDGNYTYDSNNQPENEQDPLQANMPALRLLPPSQPLIPGRGEL